MPKSPYPNDPSPSKQQANGPDKQLNDVALRKKKNADAQAAFRARRANYIATLEETGNSYVFTQTYQIPLNALSHQ